MRRTVIERPFYQEQQSNHLHTRRDDAADRIGTHFLPDSYQSGDSRRWISRDRGIMDFGNVAGENREFLSDRSYQGLPYLHSELVNSERPTHYWNEQQRREIVTGSRIPGSRAGYVDNDFPTSESSRFYTGNSSQHVRSPEHLPRIAEASYSYRLDDGHSALSSNARDVVRLDDGHSALSSRTRDVVRLDDGHSALSSCTRDVVRFDDGHSALSSRTRDVVNPHDYLLTGSFPIEPRNRSPCEYFPSGSGYQATPPSVTLQPVTVYESTRYDLDRRHRQVATSTPSSLHFDRGNIISREDRYQGVHPPQAVHVSGVPSSYVAVNAHQRGQTAKKQFVRDRDIAPGSGSSKRKRSKSASTSGNDQFERQVNFTKGSRKKEQFARDRDVRSRTKSSERERSRSAVGLVGRNRRAATTVTQERKPVRTVKLPSNECQRTENGLISTNDFLDKEIEKQSVTDALQPNILNQNGDKLATDVDTFEKAGEGNQYMVLRSRSFKRQRSSSRSSRIPEDNDHCLTLINKEHLKADTMSENCSHEGSVLPVMAAHEHQKLASHKMQLGQCSDNNPHSVTAVLTKKDDIVSATNTEQCILADQEDHIVPGNTATNALEEDVVAKADFTLSHDVNEELDGTKHIPNIASNVLEKGALDRVNINLAHELNENFDDTKPIVQIESKTLKRRRKSMSSKRGVESMTEQVTDISSQKLPSGSTGVTSLDNENATEDVKNTTEVVLENDSLKGVNIELNLAANEKTEDTNPKVKTNSGRKRLARKCKSSKSGVESMAEVLTDISSEILPASSMGVTSLDLVKETENILNTPVVLEKDEVDGVTTNLNRTVNGNVEDTKPIVTTKAKIKRRVRKSKSSELGVGSMTEEATDISSERLPLSSVGGTALAYENVVSVAAVPNDLSTIVLQNDVIRDVLANDHPVNSDLTSSLGKHNLSPGKNMLVDEMAGVNVDLSQECENPDAIKCLQNTSAVVLENSDIAGVNVDLNDEVDAKCEETKLVGKKAKKRKCRASSSKSDVEPMTDVITDPSCQRLPVSSVAGTSFNHGSVVPVSGVTDVVSTNGFSGSDDIRAAVANDRPVESEFARACEKHYISQENATLAVLPKGGSHGLNSHLSHEVTEELEETERILNTTKAVLQKDELAVAEFELNHEVNEQLEESIPLATVTPKKRKSKQQSPSSKSAVESDLESSCVRQHISSANTTTALLEKDEVAGVDVDLSNVVNEKLEETKHMQSTNIGVLEKDEVAGVSIVLNHDVKDEPKEAKHESVVPVSRITDVVSINDYPRYMMANYGPFESEFARACEKYFISRANATMSVLEKGGSRGENAHLSPDVNIKLEETKRIVNTNEGLLENDELAGVSIDLGHEVNERLEETMLPLKSKSKKRKIKQPEETKQILDASKVLLEKDEIAGVDIDLNHEMNDKNIAKHVVNSSSKTRKKLRSSSSTGGDDSNHESVMPISVVTDGMSRSIPETDGVRAMLANEHRVQSRRKLLVLDVNGLLADIVEDFPPRFIPDFKLSRKGVFKRPFCDEFLDFCFENFDVGIWSSRTRINLTRAVEVLLGDSKNRLLFCWDKSHCTETGFNTLENFHKPLVLKELTKLWEKTDNNLPWQRGFYNESNTILLDDSPYKALRNPPFTAVFPHPYSFTNVKDTSLGPNGDLRLYLARLAQAENVQHFIEANPFGQKSITQTNPSWSFYSKIAAKHETQQQRAFAGPSSGHYFPKRRRVIFAS